MLRFGRLLGPIRFLILVGQKLYHPLNTFFDLAAKRLAVLNARGLYLFECDRLASILRANGSAEEAISMKDQNFASFSSESHSSKGSCGQIGHPGRVARGVLRNERS